MDPVNRDEVVRVRVTSPPPLFLTVSFGQIVDTGNENTEIGLLFFNSTAFRRAN